MEQRLPARDGTTRRRGLDDEGSGQAEQTAHHELHPGKTNGGDPVQ